MQRDSFTLCLTAGIQESARAKNEVGISGNAQLDTIAEAFKGGVIACVCVAAVRHPGPAASLTQTAANIHLLTSGNIQRSMR